MISRAYMVATDWTPIAGAIWAGCSAVCGNDRLFSVITDAVSHLADRAIRGSDEARQRQVAQLRQGDDAPLGQIYPDGDVGRSKEKAFETSSRGEVVSFRAHRSETSAREEVVSYRAHPPRASRR